MAATIVIPASIWSTLHTHVMGPGQYAFLLAKPGASIDGVRLTVHRVLVVPPEDHDWDNDHRNISLQTLLDTINEAKRTGSVLIDVHSHKWPGPVSFSHIDRAGISNFAEYVLTAIPDHPYAAIVVNDSCAEAVWYKVIGQPRTDIRIVVEGSVHRVVPCAPDENRGIGERYGRQAVEGFLGISGQQRLQEATVCVVGVSGLGSHVAQQLAYLGVGRIILIEPERIDETNLNRLVGAGFDDIGLYKAEVIEREIRRIRGADVEIVSIMADIRDASARAAAVASDVVIGCVDNDGARLVLNRYALAHALPYFDAASGIDSPDGNFERAGGHIAAVLPEGPCYNCMGLLDAAEARYFLKDEAGRDQDRKLGYAEGWDEPAPSVVSLNGVVASATVTEALCYLTGFASPNQLTTYYLRQPGIAFQQMVRQLVGRNLDCIACTHSGQGNAVPPT